MLLNKDQYVLIQKTDMAAEFSTLSETELSPQEEGITCQAERFFQQPQHVQEFLDIIHGKSEISIRIIEWFVTNYSLRKQINYRLTVNETTEKFRVYPEYCNRLRSYTKKYFDSFCRSNKLIASWNPTDKTEDAVRFVTSIGQLNFFSWAVKYRVLDYVRRHLLEISIDMSAAMKERKQRKQQQKSASAAKRKSPKVKTQDICFVERQKKTRLSDVQLTY